MPMRLHVVRVLPLAGRLLHQLVGNFVAGELVADDQAEPVTLGQIALIVCGEIAGGSAVGVVLRHHRIEIVRVTCRPLR